MESRLNESREWLRMAREALDAARLLFERDFHRDSVSKAYYAMFYAAKAAVVSEGLEVSKHSAVISVFGQRFAKTGRMSSRLHQSLRIAFDERQLADYTLDWQVSAEAARSRLDEAELFVVEVTTFLSSLE